MPPTFNLPFENNTIFEGHIDSFKKVLVFQSNGETNQNDFQVKF